MDNFPKIKATAMSLAHRKLVQGIGVNDSWFVVCLTIDGKRMMYQPYRTWVDMLERCYSAKYQQKKPTYIGCTVCKEWLTFSAFEKWMLTQEFGGLALDKDIIKQGNKVYCPEYCRFIPQALNNLLTANNAVRGLCPMGVSWHKRHKKYRAAIRINGKTKHLGLFKTPEEAKAGYDRAKYAEIHRYALMQDDPLIRDGLLKWVVE